MTLLSVQGRAGGHQIGKLVSFFPSADADTMWIMMSLDLCGLTQASISKAYQRHRSAHGRGWGGWKQTTAAPVSVSPHMPPATSSAWAVQVETVQGQEKAVTTES